MKRSEFLNVLVNNGLDTETALVLIGIEDIGYFLKDRGFKIVVDEPTNGLF